jgi:hypothetical protein
VGEPFDSWLTWFTVNAIIPTPLRLRPATCEQSSKLVRAADVLARARLLVRRGWAILDAPAVVNVSTGEV